MSPSPYCQLYITRRQMEAIADAMVAGGVLSLAPSNPKKQAYVKVLASLDAWRER